MRCYFFVVGVVVCVCFIWLFFICYVWGFNFLFDEYEGEVVKYKCICYINNSYLVGLVYFVVFNFVYISVRVVDCLNFGIILFNGMY